MWEWYVELNDWRGYDRANNLPNLISLELIFHWCAITGVRMSHFDVEVIKRLEGAFWTALTPAPEDSSTLFSELKKLAEQEGKIRTVPMNPKKK